ncbi:MAG: NEW3 domain-containing protein, partial [Thermoplasmata archaeon]|nr:NEW3 domain-containing protein [Thermoplasmata archaeon]
MSRSVRDARLEPSISRIGGPARALIFAMTMIAVALFLIPSIVEAEVNVSNVSVSPSSRTVAPGERGSYVVTIEIDFNGTGSADIWANLTNGTDGWKAWISPANQTRTWYGVNSDRTLAITVTAEVPLDADADDDPFTAILLVESTFGTDVVETWDTTVEHVPDIDLYMMSPDNRTGFREEQVDFTLGLENPSNGADTYTINYSYDASALAITGPSSRSLQERTSSSFTVYVDIGYGARARAYYISVTATSDSDGVTSISRELTVTVSADHALMISSSDTVLNATPTRFAEFVIDVTNEGNERVDLTASMTEDISPWVHSINPTSFALDMDETTIVTVKVKPPVNATADSTRSVTLVIVPEPGKGTNATIELTTEAKQRYGVHLTGTSPGGPAYPGYWKNASISAVNDGNGDDLVALRAHGPDGWLFDFEPSSLLAVGPFGTQAIVLQIWVPEDEPYGPGLVYANATSSGDPTKVSLDLQLSIFVGMSHIVELTELEPLKVANVSASDVRVTFNFTAWNLGNRQDTVDLHFSDMSGSGYESDLTTSQLTIASGGNSAAQLWVDIPIGSAFASHTWLVWGTMGSGNSTNTLTFSVTVDQFHLFAWVNLSINPTLSDLDPGGDAFIDLVVKNTGNVLSTAVFSAVVPSGWAPATFAPASLSLNVNAQGSTRMRVRIPAEALATDFAFTVQAVADATSAVVGEVEVDIRVNAVYDLDVAVVPPETGHALPGEVAQFMVSVENLGNALDTIYLQVNDTMPGWQYAFTPTASPTIPGHGAANVSLSITIPEGTAKGSYLVNITGRTHGIWDIDQQALVIVDQTFSVGFDVLDDLLEGYPEDVLSFIIAVENPGNG